MRIRTLACHRDVQMTTHCLRSLVQVVREPIEIVLHDDGSLTSADFEQFRGALGCNVERVNRVDADDRVADMLRRYPNCAHYRRENVFGLKLFDTILLETDDTTRYCDGDIVFYRPVAGIFDLPDQTDAVFMMDAFNSYAVRSWHIALRRIQLVRILNAGMYVFRRSCFDLDRLEWFLGLKLPTVLKHTREQTAWAVLAGSIRSKYWNPRNARVMLADDVLHESELIAGHFVGASRDGLEGALAGVRHRLSQEPVMASYVPANRCTASEMARYEVARIVGRCLPWAKRSVRNEYGDFAMRRTQNAGMG